MTLERRPSPGRIAVAIVLGWLATTSVVVALATSFWLFAGREAIDPSAPGFRTMLIIELIVSGLAGGIGGWIAARLSDSRPWSGTLGLVIVMVVLAFPTSLAESTSMPLWDLVLLPLVGIVGVLAGGAWRAR